MTLFGLTERIIATASSVVPSRLKVTLLMEPTRTCFIDIGLTHITVGSQSGVSSSCFDMISKQRSAGALAKVLRTIVTAPLWPGLIATAGSPLENVSGPSWTIRGWGGRWRAFVILCNPLWLAEGQPEMANAWGVKLHRAGQSDPGGHLRDSCRSVPEVVSSAVLFRQCPPTIVACTRRKRLIPGFYTCTWTPLAIISSILQIFPSLAST